ncbi:unnamed protein product [marine sediment metagenome]|uniref:Uncharacterized protein n=1 Tax=marine sediment metagenome TaxID=412755 RepID=X0V2W6_9ZZZZ
MANKLLKWLVLQKEGALIGGGLGLTTYFIWDRVVPKQMSVLTDIITGSQGIIDKITPNVDIKIMLFFIFVGVFCGIIVDMLYKPSK